MKGQLSSGIEALSLSNVNRASVLLSCYKIRKYDDMARHGNDGMARMAHTKCHRVQLTCQQLAVAIALSVMVVSDAAAAADLSAEVCDHVVSLPKIHKCCILNSSNYSAVESTWRMFEFNCAI